MSKRLICTERPLAALGREDVMKRVFFSPLCREKPAAGWCVGRGDGGGGGVLGDSGGGCGQWDSCSTRPLYHPPPPQPLPILLTAPLERIVIYLVSHERERCLYAGAYGPGPGAGRMGGTWGHYVGTCRGTCPLSALSRLWGWSAGRWCGPLFVLLCLKRGKFKCCSHSGLRAGKTGRVS